MNNKYVICYDSLDSEYDLDFYYNNIYYRINRDYKLKDETYHGEPSYLPSTDNYNSYHENLYSDVYIKILVPSEEFKNIFNLLNSKDVTQVKIGVLLIKKYNK